jgi:exosome complex component CSL4
MECLKEGIFVINGTELCEAEQYMGENESVFEENGKLIAAQSGHLRINDKNRTIRIENKNTSITINKGDKVICEVLTSRKFSIGCQIHKVGDQLVKNPIFGNIHISQISNSYVESVDVFFKKTDIVRCTVSGLENNEYALSTKYGNNMGVIHADCSVCGTAMKRQSFDTIVCPFCGNTERRKLANDYGDFDP